MIFVGIDDLKLGMILELPVKNSQGILLLEAGARITKKNIRIFKSWGVIEVSVKWELDELKAAGETPVAGVKDTVEMELKAKFSNVLDDPVMVEIFNAACKLLVKDLQKNEHEKENSRP